MQSSRLRQLVIIALLLVPTCGFGCTGTPTGDGGLRLPSFGAPEQWEPEVPETPATGEEEES